MNVDRYAAVQMDAFGKGMQKLFEGVAEVFSAIGAAEPERLALEKQKWIRADQACREHTAGAPVSRAPENGKREIGGHAEEVHKPEKKTRTEREVQAEAPGTDISGDTERPGGKEMPGEPAAEYPAPEQHEHAADDMAALSQEAGGEAGCELTVQDIMDIIQYQIQQAPSKKEAIGALLKTYGADRLSDLSPARYEAFLNDLAAI